MIELAIWHLVCIILAALLVGAIVGLGIAAWAELTGRWDDE